MRMSNGRLFVILVRAIVACSSEDEEPGSSHSSFPPEPIAVYPKLANETHEHLVRVAFVDTATDEVAIVKRVDRSGRSRAPIGFAHMLLDRLSLLA